LRDLAWRWQRSQGVTIRLVESEILGIAEPSRRLQQSAPQTRHAGVARLPVQELAGLVIRGTKPFDFTLRRSHALLVAMDLDPGTHELGVELHRLADRDLEAGARVDDLAHGPRTAQGCEKTRHRILHIVEIASWMQSTEADLPHAARDLGHHSRD